MDDRAPMEITIGAVIVASALASLLGWGLLALLERFTARAVTIWPVAAVLIPLLPGSRARDRAPAT
jgi:hypothetical protein